MGSREPRSAISILAALALAMVFASSGRGQQATDVTLTVSFANGQTVFHVGRKPTSTVHTWCCAILLRNLVNSEQTVPRRGKYHARGRWVER